MGERLGQHFLNSNSILEKIAVAVCPGIEPVAIEIGPGRGALTAHLLPRVGKLVAVELDAELAARLRQRFAGDERVEIIEGNVLNVDLSQWGPAVVVGNLPYYITSPILDKTLRLGALCPRAVFLVQKEVALRLTAQPGSRDYGYLSVRTQALANVRKILNVKAGAFDPPPKVDSAVVTLTPHPPPAEDAEGFLRFVGWCFEHKRKTLRNNLTARYGMLTETDLPEWRMRAEQLSIAELAAIWERLKDLRRSG